METNIYYFSGTGNSLFIAQKLIEKMGNAKLISIAKAIKQKTIGFDETIGIVCPIYMHNIPLIVVDFIKKITQPKYFFIVFAGGGEMGNCMKITKKLCNSQKLKLSAVFNIKMPSNYTPYGCPPKEEQREDFEKAIQKLDAFARIITAGEQYMEKNDTGFFRTFVHPGLLYKLGYKYINQMAKSYIADEKCNGCAICAQVCPVNNITMIEDRPNWNSACQQCYACLQWCPQEAIQFGNKTSGIPRYHNPYIKVKAIIESAR